MPNHHFWLLTPSDFKERLKSIADARLPADKITAIRALSHCDLDFVQINQLARRLSDLPGFDPAAHGLRSVRLAILASSTVDYLLPSIRIAALRHGVWVEAFVAPYNQYRQEVLTPQSSLYAFKPDVVLFAIDAKEAVSSLSPRLSADQARAALARRMDEWASLWDTVKTTGGATVVQQTIVVPSQPLFGQFDRLMPVTPAHQLHELNDWFARQARERGLILFDVDALASEIGKNQWCNQSLWFHAKQAISPLYAPHYGEHLARLLAALRGLSRKVLVVDLDNTLWGGVIGDDGLEGIEIGQGTGVGEAYLAFQQYLQQLRERGILLAACSKNEEINALLPFREHTEMSLRRDDFAVFVANWNDKATNLESISRQLNLGLESFVFFDDNPAERELIRRMLPMVAVPEVPEDPADYVACLSRAGYFETVSFTNEDSQRANQYQADTQRESLRSRTFDLSDYLTGLAMEMSVSPFDDQGAARIAQLINKSNQFNLTTRRYTLEQVQQMQRDPSLITLQIHLKDSFGDHGMISVVILKPFPEDPAQSYLIDTWLMSCRVLGRQVEEEVLNQIVDETKRRGGRSLIGEYIPTPKNQMVQTHYQKLGFAADSGNGILEHTFWKLGIERFSPFKTTIRITLKERTAQ